MTTATATAILILLIQSTESFPDLSLESWWPNELRGKGRGKKQRQRCSRQIILLGSSSKWELGKNAAVVTVDRTDWLCSLCCFYFSLADCLIRHYFLLLLQWQSLSLSLFALHSSLWVFQLPFFTDRPATNFSSESRGSSGSSIFKLNSKRVHKREKESLCRRAAKKCTKCKVCSSSSGSPNKANFDSNYFGSKVKLGRHRQEGTGEHRTGADSWRQNTDRMAVKEWRYVQKKKKKWKNDDDEPERMRHNLAECQTTDNELGPFQTAAAAEFSSTHCWWALGQQRTY